MKDNKSRELFIKKEKITTNIHIEKLHSQSKMLLNVEILMHVLEIALNDHIIYFLMEM